MSKNLHPIRTKQMIGDPSLVKELNKAIHLVDHACAKYPTDPGATAKTLAKDEKWIVDKMYKWERLLNKTPGMWELQVLLNMAYQSIIDVLSKVRDPGKVSLLEPILEPLSIISDFINEKDVDYAACEYADDTLNGLYKILNFEV